MILEYAPEALQRLQLNPNVMKIRVIISKRKAEIFDMRCRLMGNLSSKRNTSITSYTNAVTETLVECLSDLLSTSSYPIIFVGDFNSDIISSTIPPSEISLHSFVSTSDLTHLIRNPTRNTRCIDWLLASDSSIVHNPSVIPSFPSSDHFGISFSLDSTCLPPSQSLIRDFARANYDAMSTFLEHFDWFTLFSHDPHPEPMYCNFVSVIQHAIDLFVTTALNPLCPPILLTFKTLSVIETSFFLRFTFPLFALNTRSVVEIFYFKSKNGTNFNSKDLYRHIRSLTSPKVSIPKELIDSSGTTVSGVLNIANLIASRFASHFTLDDGFLPTIPSHPLTPFLCNVSFLPHEVHKALKQLSPSCSKGHDNIPQIVFRKCAQAISLPLCDIYNISMQSGVVPSLWKLSLITPLPKPDKNPKLAESYRPISILSPASKTMERLVKQKLAPYLFRFDIIPKYQHGFRSGSSPIPQFSINNVPLVTVPQQRDLGVQVIPSLLNRASIEDRVKKATTVMNIMLRSVSVNNPAILIKCFRTYVLSHIEFASPFWNPYIKKESQKLEKIQEKFTRILFYRCFPSPSYPHGLPSYPKRLSYLGLPALFERRVIYDLVLARRIMNGDTLLDRNRFFTFTPLRCRTNNFGIYIEHTKSTPRYHCFSRRQIERGEQFLVDESYVQLGKNAQTCFVRNRADAVKAAPKHVPKLLIWAGISVRGPTPITILRGKDCIVNSLKYQQILHDTFLEATFGPIGKLVQDAAPCHSSKRSEIMVEEWPPESPDLMPIETVWAIMKRWVDGEWRPNSLDHLEEGIRYWWTNHCTKDLCIRLIEREYKPK
ncbi:hypothetical protein PRIPAC_77245 [Pristionchus pacificus]|uniref:Uncharacterized protein n=1 Tax=Pristionchus pacificus TaxID=54126 RepID=A0A2A6BVZ9_PRIPA|nr:hypothetical protein PRIPAC_77245 [Pristionchus pacificus]|eukprot:PDM69941.1 hypothetical protein PRIPAC_49153 [Pristionchus pacificus]